MRILYFSRDYGPHDHRFLSAIAEAGHEIFFLRLERRNLSTEQRPLPPRVREIAWVGGESLFSWFRVAHFLQDLRKVIADVKPDLFHAGPLPTCGTLAAASGFHPLVLVSWGSDLLYDAQRKVFTRWLTRYSLRHADVLIGDCLAVRHAAQAFAFPENKIITFPWGVDLQRFSPHGGDGGLRAQLGWEKAFVLLHMRSWERFYGAEMVMRVFLHLASNYPELHLLMPGSGSLTSRLQKMIRKAELENRVYFPGQLKQDLLPNYYRAADLYVSASRSDGSSVSLMEALACGLPALVSDIPGNREWVELGEEGWLFPLEDEAALADCIVTAIEQRNSLKEMSKRARHRAEGRANWERNKTGLFRAYDLAMKGVT